MMWDDLPAFHPVGDAERGTREILTSAGPREASIWWRPGLAPGRQIVGPAVIEEGEATTYLDRGERAVVLESGALEVAW